MIYRNCLIGNSHLIMVQQAWKEADDAVHSGGTIDFFASLVRFADDLSVEGTRLVPTSDALSKAFQLSSGGSGVIETEGYDRFVLVGMRLGLAEIFRMMRHFSLTGAEGATGLRALLSWRASL